MKLLHLLKLFKAVGIFGSAQILTQVLGFSSGILAVRYLSPGEYALFTLANSFVATMVVLSDCGVSASVASQIGQVWQSRLQMGEVLSTGRDVRKKFGVISALVTIPFFFLSLTKHSAGYWDALAIVIISTTLFWVSFSGNMLLIPALIHQKITVISKVSTLQAIFRLILLFVVALFFPFASLAILASVVSQYWANSQNKEICKTLVDWNAESNSSVKENIFSFVKKSLPNAIYYSISGQINIFLISFFGATEGLAQVGALGRIGQIFVLISSVINGVLVARFTRIPANSGVLLKYFLGIVGVTIGAGLLLVLVTWRFTNQVLWILGPQYQNLDSQVIIAIAASAVGMVSSVTYNLGAARAWIASPKLFIPMSIASQAILISLLDLSTVSGILWLGLLAQLPTFLFQILSIAVSARKADAEMVV